MKPRGAWFAELSATPVLNVISRAHGIYIEDLDGKKFIDMHGNGVDNAGFNNPKVIAAVKRQPEPWRLFIRNFTGWGAQVSGVRLTPDHFRDDILTAL